MKKKTTTRPGMHAAHELWNEEEEDDEDEDEEEEHALSDDSLMKVGVVNHFGISLVDTTLYPALKQGSFSKSVIMDGERDFQLCTNDHGQPIVDDQGRNIYYCKITGDVAVFDNEPHTLDETSINENTNEIEKDVTQSVEPQSEGQMSATNEDRFTHEMTVKLLEIVQSKFHFLNDKMHSKKKIWADITTKMQKTGYLVTYGTKTADKCHQRWRNLEKMYHGHCRYIKSTGTEKKKPPKYFDEMHELIGEKHSSQPVNLLDSLDDVSTASASDTCSIETKSSEAINNNETDNFPDNVDNESNNIKENIDSNVF
ncbi:uncharacterized protein LOC143905784 [Temnothorax americanus]|uniref:uncharacterized protein LOC143905784 n=1 Tax=Temnothorax americanus TaxID=1964332 RepID=UPI00406778E5